ncbi:hypothetical protein ACP70R_039778 [Stipagrostis hirtigluma subsp. patula]
MQAPLRRAVSAAAATAPARLLRAVFTATDSPPPCALIPRISSTAPLPSRRASFSLAPPPFPSRITVPEHVFDLGADPREADCINTLGSGVHAASGEGLLLLTCFKVRYRAHPLSKLDLPVDVLFKIAPFKVVYQYFWRFVCNPISGELVRLPDFDGQDKVLGDQYLGLITESGGRNGPPERYAVAQLNDEDGEGGERRFVWRRFASETGEWVKLVMPSPLPPGRKMDLNHEVLAFGGRLWWVDVSWGAVSADPFSDRPDLRSIELPAGSMLPDQEGYEVMKRLIKRRRMGVSEGKLRYAEVSSEEPFLIKLFTLDDESGRWTLEHQVPFAALVTRGGYCPVPLIGAIDPVNADILYLSIDREINLAVNMREKEVIGCSLLGDVRPAKNSSSFFLPCMFAPGLASSPIPGKKEVAKGKTLADILVRPGRDQKK